MSANASAPAVRMQTGFIGFPLDARFRRAHERGGEMERRTNLSTPLSAESRRQGVGLRQRFSLRLRQERHRDQPKNVEQADNGRGFAVAAEADNQGAGDQRSDRGDQPRRIEDETGGSGAHSRWKEFRQPN